MVQTEGRESLRNGVALIAGGCALAAMSYFAGRFSNAFAAGMLFWGMIRVIRGLRLRREAWELQHLGFIDRERQNRNFTAS